MQSVHPFLMFEGNAEAAMNLYVSLFPDASIGEILRYGPDEPGAEGSVVKASFTIGGQTFLCIDSPVKHGFNFTPSFSIFVECSSDAEMDRLVAVLGEGGTMLMPRGDYGFSRSFAWLNDRFGLSWQINLQ